MDINNRRFVIDLNVPSELAIQNAIWEVESAGADERLTQAVELLMEAKNLVSDYIDMQVEAVQWAVSKESFDKIISMGCPTIPGEMGSGCFYIQTPEGNIKVSKGDYVIKGANGEFYTSK